MYSNNKNHKKHKITHRIAKKMIWGLTHPPTSTFFVGFLDFFNAAKSLSTHTNKDYTDKAVEYVTHLGDKSLVDLKYNLTPWDLVYDWLIFVQHWCKKTRGVELALLLLVT